MISYPEANFVHNFSAELLENTKDLPLYGGGPAVDYTAARHAYALNATLLHDPQQDPGCVLSNGPSEAAQILLVERASGHGVVGSFSGVSGYIDTLYNPDAENTDVLFDPIAHTLKEEFVTECGFTEQSFDLVDFYAGKLTTEDRTITPGAKISVVPILGLCARIPEISVDKAELASYRWIDLQAIKHTESLARGYLGVTLPSALGAIGLEGNALDRLLR
jgi:hypothetical protein